MHINPKPSLVAAASRNLSRVFGVTLASILGAALPAFAGLCPLCKGKSHAKDIGHCKDCNGLTTSGEFQFCVDCSERLQQCEQCGKPLDPAAPKLDEKPEGIHKSGRWIYQYSISHAGSMNEGYYGKLSFAGEAIPQPAGVNDHVRTPWGLIYWVGKAPKDFFSHGWMPGPLPHAPVGKLVVPPADAPPVVVKVKLLAADRGKAPEEEWIRKMMKDMKIPNGVGSGSQWISLGRKPVVIHDSKRFGQAYLAVVDPGGKRPLRLEITGSHAGAVEISKEPGTHKIVPHTISSSSASLDLYFAITVEAK